MQYVVGIDEVGRGPLAGPVTVCAVQWISKKQKELILAGIRDSKKTPEHKRNEWAAYAKSIRGKEIEYAVCSINAEIIDKVGITRALLMASSNVLQKMNKKNKIQHVYSDYNLPLPEKYPATHIVKGDESNPIIALSSIIAKVARDTHMKVCGEQYPAYGFERNKGYGTREHIQSIKEKGIIGIHRKTYLTNII